MIEVPVANDSQHVETPAESEYSGYNNNDSIKNKFGLGVEAEAWDNDSYANEEDDGGD